MANSLQQTERVWNVCGYVRLSREDGDKEESNSVTGQKDLIRDYLSRHPDLRERGMKVDDGFTGSNFDRPGFQSMMEDVKAGRINCIVVKDLSRFGREHLDAGKYIENIFPFFGVRFIAINDHYDSLHRNPESDEIILPFRNMLNEAYCRDTSIKVRSLFAVKRDRGDFIGSSAPFGYMKSPDDRHKLVADDFASGVVRDIFRWKIQGLGIGDIADALNEKGVPTPMDYKKSRGVRYDTPFRTKKESVWGATMVLRILQNPVYIGTLEQGRVTTPSYKVKRIIQKPREEWAVVENCHEAIIDRLDFEIVQKALSMDTRTSVAGRPADIFGGVLRCRECGAPMVRKTVPSGRKKFVYYVCSAHKSAKTCSSHNIRDTVLEGIVLQALQVRIRTVVEVADLLEMADIDRIHEAKMRKLRTELDEKRDEIERQQKYLNSLYESLTDGIIDRSEYKKFKKKYAERREEAEKQAEAIQAEMSKELTNDTEGRAWMERFRENLNFTSLDRAIVITLIDRIWVSRDRTVEIVFNWDDEFRRLLESVPADGTARTEKGAF